SSFRRNRGAHGCARWHGNAAVVRPTRAGCLLWNHLHVCAVSRAAQDLLEALSLELRVNANVMIGECGVDGLAPEWQHVTRDASGRGVNRADDCTPAGTRCA